MPVSDRGLAYGDGVFETVRVMSGQPVLLDYHLERLQTGLQRLRIEHDWQALKQEILAYLGWQQAGWQQAGADQSAIVKLIVTRGSGGRGYGTAQVKGPTCILSCHPLPEYPSSYFTQGISVFSCGQRLSSNASLAGIKHLNRLEQVLARQEWSDEHQEGLMLDQDDNVIEGVFSNLFVMRDGVIKTPDLQNAGVAGVMRRWLLECFDNNGVRADVAQVTLQDIQLADEWFFCNSVYGIWPVCRWEDKTWAVGEITRQAQQWVKDRWQF